MQRAILPAVTLVALMVPTLETTGAAGAELASDLTVLKSVVERFAWPRVEETPHFRRHVVPLLGKLGCNGRACHGSFKGRGGFRLSLFGYDFQMDHRALNSGEQPRVDLKKPAQSLMLQKSTLLIPHEGGRRMEAGGWEHKVLLGWIRGGAKAVDDDESNLVWLEVTPSEIVFGKSGQSVPLRVVAVWADGTKEDVTPLTRFRSKDSQVANVNQEGLVTPVESGDTHVVAFYDNGVVPVPVICPRLDSASSSDPDVPTLTPIDRLVVQKLRKLGVVPSAVCSDAEFLRRLSLDLTGSLPSAKEVKEFLGDSSPDKREEKIDELLERPTYAAWWTTRLCDLTGNNARAVRSVGLKRGQANQEWYDWIYRRVAENMQYDELVAGIVLARSREPGQSYTEYSKQMSERYRTQSEWNYADHKTLTHYWARATVRRPQEKAMSFAYTFLGLRIQCAKCHKHPFDRWTQDDYQRFTNLFTGINYGISRNSKAERSEIIKALGFDASDRVSLREYVRAIPKLLEEGKTIPFKELYVVKPKKDRTMPVEARLLDGAVVYVTKYDDPREALIQWLRKKKSNNFARAFVNRVWAAYFNVGIVEPPDDLSLANPPSNRALLDYLTEEFIWKSFDMKWLHREITNSQTYQRSWKPNQTNRLDRKNFSRATLRRLPAEVLYDAFRQATASDDTVEKMQVDLSERAIAAPGNQGPGAGRKQRKRAGQTLEIFGKSARKSNCDCERSNDANLLQTIFLQNDIYLLNMIDRSNDSWLAQLRTELKNSHPTDSGTLIQQAYLRTFSRYPSEKEAQRAHLFIREADDVLSGLRGLMWALLNTKEFIVNR